MSALELRAALSLASIFALRMLGLFVILPVFAIHAPTLPGFDLAMVGWVLGIFSLHMVLMAMFVVVPTALVESGGMAPGSHWKVYLPALLLSFAVMMPPIIWAEKHGRNKCVLLGAVALMLVSQLAFVAGIRHVASITALLFVFFVAFNILEAQLPALVSRFAPAAARGAALGVYNTTQALGLALGGVVGG